MGNKNTKGISIPQDDELCCVCYNCVLQASSLHSKPRMALDSRKGFFELEVCSRENKIIVGQVIQCSDMASVNAPKLSVPVTSSDVGDLASEFLRRERENDPETKFLAAINLPDRPRSPGKGPCKKRLTGELF